LLAAYFVSRIHISQKEGNNRIPPEKLLHAVRFQEKAALCKKMTAVLSLTAPCEAKYMFATHEFFVFPHATRKAIAGIDQLFLEEPVDCAYIFVMLSQAILVRSAFALLV
jgi:hypothetical protein